MAKPVPTRKPLAPFVPHSVPELSPGIFTTDYEPIALWGNAVAERLARGEQRS